MVNPNIFSQFAAPRSIADYQGDAQRREANALTLEGVKRKNAMEDMALQQGQAKQNALMQIMQGWTPKTTAQERAASLRTNPLTYGDADAIEKADLEAQKTRAGISAQDAESLTKNLGVLKRLTGAVMSDPTPENARAAIQMWEQLTGKQLPQERERVAFLQTPEQVRSWAAGYAMEADKLLPQLSTQNLGGNMASVARDPLSGAVTTNALTPITQSADNAASQAQSDKNNRRTVGASLQNAAAQRAIAQAQNNQTNAWQTQMRELQLDEARNKQGERNRSKQAAVDSVNAQLSVIDKALDHPGRETATGLSGAVDPRNYIPGTQSADFQAVLAQINGTAFLQAFESLKGGGQITEVEGRKATEAIARLNRSQSDAEFEASLAELRGVMEKGYERLTGQPAPPRPKPAAKGDSFSDAEKERRYQEWKAKQK